MSCTRPLLPKWPFLTWQWLRQWFVVGLRDVPYGTIHDGPECRVFRMWASQCFSEFEGGEPGDQCARMQRWLDKTMGDLDWPQTFQKPTVLLYDDMQSREHLICLHYWLRGQAADLDNVLLINNHHVGIASWYQHWLDLYHDVGFTIVELPYTHSYQMFYTAWYELTGQAQHVLDQESWIQHKRDRIRKLFSFYGGRHNCFMDKFYLLLKALEFGDEALVDIAAPMKDREIIYQYLEYVTDYKSGAEVERLMAVLDRYVTPQGDFHNPVVSVFYETAQKPRSLCDVHVSYTLPLLLFDPGNAQWRMDLESFACVIRETFSDQPYGILTEKTYRAFLNHVAVIPINYQAVDYLESLGFWFPRDIMDYDYQHVKHYGERVHGAMLALRKLQSNMTYADLNQYWLTNVDHFHHNATLMRDFIMEPWHQLDDGVMTRANNSLQSMPGRDVATNQTQGPN